MADSPPDDPTATPSDKIDLTVPHSARIWNYWMGGKDNYEVDRIAGDQWLKLQPEMTLIAQQGRQFLIRTVRFLALDAGIRQYLDVGTGLPTMQNTHEIAQSLIPAARIVYVDNDPLVLAHARALLVNTTPEGVTTYVDADFEDPELIVSDARNVLNFNEPIGVMFMGVLGHVAEYEKVRWIINTIMDATPSGSYLALYDALDNDERAVRAAQEYAATGAVPYALRSYDQVCGYFDGLEMVEPGFKMITEWRIQPDIGTPTKVNSWGAVARKP